MRPRCLESGFRDQPRLKTAATLQVQPHFNPRYPCQLAMAANLLNPSERGREYLQNPADVTRGLVVERRHVSRHSRDRARSTRG